MDSNVVCKYSMFKVAGNSMDNGKRGSFENGDSVYAKQFEMDEFRNEILNDIGSYWIFDTIYGLQFGQVMELGDRILCHTLNPDYNNFYVILDEVKTVYRIMKLQPKTVYYGKN